MKGETSSHSGYPALRMHIDGEWVGPGNRRTQRVVNPANGETLGELPLADAADLERALAATDRAWGKWRRASAEERSAVLVGAARLLRERAEQIARNATLEEGKTLGEARTETLVTARLFEFYAGEVWRLYGRVLVRPAGTRSLVVKEPVGPIAAFAPWNFPIGNPGRKLGAPVAAGCAVILKPAEEAPASAMAVTQALLDAGLPSGVVQLVYGVPDEVSRQLLASPVIRKLSFTGSVAVGKHLMQLAAQTMKRTTLELGGHAPVVVFDDADIDHAIGLLIPAKLRNAGQICVSPTRFYLQEAIHDRFVEAFARRLGRVRLGDGLSDDTEMGPLANPRRRDAMAELIADALAHGARLHTGGERRAERGFFFAPTLLTDVPLDARIMNEEPFGPIAVTARFESFDEAVEHANRLSLGLAAYAFTGNVRRANLIADAVDCGMVAVNTTTIAAADAPFQGVKESGHGSEDGPEGVQECLITKTIHQA